MTRSRCPAFLVAMLLLVSAQSLAAELILGMTPLTGGGLGSGVYGDGSGRAYVQPWSMVDGYSNVTIIAAVSQWGPISSPGTAYLMTAIGPAATTLDIVAQTGYTAVAQQGGWTTIFTGLTLPPDDYYLMLIGGLITDAPGSELANVWGFADFDQLTLVMAPGVTPAAYLDSVTLNSGFPPSSTFHANGVWPTGGAALGLQVLGDTVVPEPSTSVLLLVGIIGLTAGRRVVKSCERRANGAA